MEKLIAILYILMRDEIPTGTIPKILLDIEKCTTNEFEFTNKHLEQYARELANRIFAKVEMSDESKEKIKELKKQLPWLSNDQAAHAIKHGHSVEHIEAAASMY